MKGNKLTVCALSAALLLSGCGGMSNTAKGGLIGGASGGALGALVGQLIGHGKGAAIGAAVGTAVGAGAINCNWSDSASWIKSLLRI